ncbi:MAG: DUF721 domain-containing protein [Tannerella sp.]|jgi:hypothetical protein|nr:DUF721 domain-containing protein [Tannerella sp.]
MYHRKTEKIDALMKLFWRDNPEAYHKMLEARVMRLWDEIIDPKISQKTTSIYVIHRVLHVSMSSSVLRSELQSMRKRLVTTLNNHAGSNVIDDVIIR